MKYYAQMLEMGSFDRKTIIEFTGSDGAARSIIYDYLKNGYIERVRRDYYVAISLETMLMYGKVLFSTLNDASFFTLNGAVSA